MADPQPVPARGEEFRRQLRQALAARKKAERRRRGRCPAPQVTGYRIPQPQEEQP